MSSDVPEDLPDVVVPSVDPSFFWTGTAILCMIILWMIQKHFSRSSSHLPREPIRTPEFKQKETENQIQNPSVSKLNILFGSTTGTAKKFADLLADDALKKGFHVRVSNLANLEPEDTLALFAAEENSVTLILISTYTDGTPPESATWFCRWLEETAKDFRYFFFQRG